MIFQEKYLLDPKSSRYFLNQIDLLIVGWDYSETDRKKYVPNLFDEFKGDIIELNVCENIDKLSFRLTNKRNSTVEEKMDLSLIPDLQNLIKTRFQNSRVCIDITFLKQPILFLLIKIFFTTFKPKRLFAAYTEPLSYSKKDFKPLVGEEEYDLYERLMEVSISVPGFTKHRDSNRDDLLIASIGFESQRLYKVYDSIKPKKFIPILGFPSFVPGWNLTAIKMNHLVIKHSESQSDLEKCEAASPFPIYNTLNDLFNQHSEKYQIILSPLGTRPQSLGIAMFAANNPNTYLIYDFPIEKKYRSEGVLKGNIYHLSNYINY